MKVRKNFWGGKLWYNCHGGCFDGGKIKLTSDGKTLEFACKDSLGNDFKGYYDNGRWVDTIGK